MAKTIERWASSIIRLIQGTELCDRDLFSALESEHIKKGGSLIATGYGEITLKVLAQRGPSEDNCLCFKDLNGFTKENGAAN